ncbi:MAG: right-handed parallel beta-helix repeat-containing protein, partial [Clostridia bacterium]|nr:right-handed parallel beta-helix repeat-containing protein [Clostridia bacterium]
LNWLSAKSLPTVYNVDPEWTLYRWRAVVDADTTTIFVNFREYDPNAETVEINVRECCFYPSRTGRSYITLRGFEIAHAACNFTPPTADQRAMVGPNWSKGWIIENNHLHDAKCSAISIGKEGSTGDNEYTRYGRKYCHYYQTESAFRALEAGWDKAHVGSHVIRHNEIHDCGQNAIVGNLGCVFSRIEHNHVYNINLKREFYGHEVAIIKLHAAIDVQIVNNCIHGCHRGIWLDWQAQGTRVTKNLFYGNNEDFFLEVTHGPCLVDHNVMLSPNTLRNAAHGTAYVHNLFGGNMFQFTVMERQHPYHFPHSTKVLGIAPIYCYDDRVLNNAILGLPSDSKEFIPVSESYKNAQTSEEFEERIKTPYKLLEYPRFPVWFEGNAIPSSYALHRTEKDRIDACGLSASLEVQDDQWILTLTVPESVAESNCRPVTTERLGATIFSEQMYENPDGTPIDFAPDMLNEKRKDTVLPGPFATLKAGDNRFTLCKK